MLAISRSFVSLIVISAAVNHAVNAIQPLTKEAAAAITKWLATKHGKVKEYVPLYGALVEIRKSSGLVGFAEKVGLHSFIFDAPYFGFTAEYTTDGGADTRRDYPALLGGAKVMRIVASIKLGGHDKNDLEYEISPTMNLVSINADEKPITKPSAEATSTDKS